MADHWSGDPGSAFFQLAMDSCPDLVFVKDQDCKILYANKAMLGLYPPEIRPSVIGTTTVENFSEEEADVFLAKDRETFATGQTTTVEEIAAYTGCIRTFSVPKTRFLDDGGHARLLGVASDISELVRRERELASANATLQQFAAVAAHDLVNPLASIGMMMQLVQADRNTTLSPKAASRIANAGLMIGGMSNQVQALLTMCKIHGGKLLERDATDLEAVVDRVALGLSSLLEATGANLTCATLPILDCQPVLVEALFQNLVENSVKYRSADKPLIHISHRLRGARHVFSITDNGMGMSKADGERAFGLGGQLDANSSGAGLGLSMCKSIVELHGGSLWVDDATQRGSCISFTLSTAA